MIILPKFETANGRSLTHPFLIGSIVEIGNKMDRFAFTHTIPLLDQQVPKFENLYPLLSQRNNTDHSWLSIVKVSPDEKTGEIIAVCNRPVEGFPTDTSMQGRILRWFGEHLYDKFVNNCGGSIVNGRISFYGEIVDRIEPARLFVGQEIYEYCRDYNYRVPFFGMNVFEKGVTLTPKKRSVDFIIFSGIRARVVSRLAIEFDGDTGNFKGTRTYTINPALGVKEIDESNQLTIIEEGISSDLIYPKNQAIVEAWLKAIVSGM